MVRNVKGGLWNFFGEEERLEAFRGGRTRTGADPQPLAIIFSQDVPQIFIDVALAYFFAVLGGEEAGAHVCGK